MSSTPSTTAGPARPHTKWSFAVLFGVAGSIVVGLVVLAFVWPIATASAKNLPIAISGPSASVAAVEKAIHDKAAGVIDFHEVADRAAAVAKIKDRTVYGAIILLVARFQPGGVAAFWLALTARRQHRVS